MGIFSFLKRKTQDATPSQPVAATDGDIELQSYGPGGKTAFDGIVNWMTGQGGANDPATASKWLMASTENWLSLINVHRSSWIAKKIIDKKPTDMLRAGWDPIWEGSGEKKGGKQTQADQLRQSAMRFQLDAKILEAMKWARLFGGSVIVLGIKGQFLTDPLPVKNGAVDYSGIKKGNLGYLEVYDRWRAAPDGSIDSSMAAKDGSGNPNRGKPEFLILSADGGMTGQRVHWSRCIRFDGAFLPWWQWVANARWHDSVLQVLLDLLKQYDSLTGAISSLVPKARMDIVGAKNAARELADAEGASALGRRYAASTRLASMYNVWIYDKDTEEYKQQAFNFAGLDKIWEKSMKEVAGATGYPVSVLFGDEPAGMNATGDASQRNYYDDISSARETELKPQHLALLECIARHEFGYLPDGFSIQYKPLWQASDLEKSTINLNRANADAIRIKDGVISPDLAARQAKEDSLYSTMTQDDVDMVVELKEAVEEDDPEGVDPIPPAQVESPPAEEPAPATSEKPTFA
jgi:phage-related protein (TIGR01555 family)